jgi:hypothetical protein
LAAYEQRGGTSQLDTREAARERLLENWIHDGENRPHASRLIMAYTRDDVQRLNRKARAARHGVQGAGCDNRSLLCLRDPLF